MSEALATPAPLPWWKRRLLSFDIESTSPDPEQARIVTAACACVGGGEPVQVRNWLVNPGVPIPAEASAIHGITDELAAAGMPAPIAVREIADVLASAAACGLPIVIMNAPYDLTVLDRELERHGLGSLDPQRITVIDPKVLDKQARQRRKGGRKLVDLCAIWGAKIDGAHDAAHDALAAARIAYRIGQRHALIGSLSLEVLQQVQHHWYREQAHGLEAHWIAKGDPRRVDSFEWPMRKRRAA